MLRTVFYAALGLALAGSQARAANPHFVEGPDFAATSQVVSCSGKIAGLGNKDIVIRLEATATADVLLYNPAGQFVPGQNKITFRVLGEVSISKSEIKNGNVVFAVNAPINPPPVDARDFGAPNKLWTAVVSNVQVSKATLTVEQGGSIVLTATQP